MQRDLVFLGRSIVDRRIGQARLADRDIGEQRATRRLVIDPRTAERGVERGIGGKRVVHGGAKR
jgi:hypothetical protein